MLDVPHEHLRFATDVEKAAYEAKNPGKFHLAQKFGPAVPGASPKDLMGAKDYQNLIAGPNGELPNDLAKALAKYRDRILKEQHDRNPKVRALLDYLKERMQAKKAIDTAEVDEIVARLRDMEDNETRMTME